MTLTHYIVALRMSSSADDETSTTMSNSESESGTDDNDDSDTYPIVDLTYERLQSLHATGRVNKHELSDYAKRGMKGTRVKKAVLQPRCECMCKMPIKLLYRICIAFWTLTKPTQDSLLWSIQTESGNQKRKRWHLAGPRTNKSISHCTCTSTHMYSKNCRS